MMNEASVTHYLDSLNNLSSNPYYKIKKEAADNGDLILSCEYAMNEQYLYKCLQVSVRFRYIKGTNICTRQMLTGYEEYAQDNLQFIREKFTNVSSGNWEMDYGDNGLKIHAEFKGEDKYFTLDYELGSDKNAVKKIKQKNEWIKIDRSYMNNIYLPDDLFEKFKKLHDDLDETKTDTFKAFGKFVKTLGTSFINKFTGKEINDPTPKVIIPKEKTLDRIQKILNHNLAAYARDNQLDTPDDLDDWSIADMHSDDWEQSLYQYVDNITILNDDPPEGGKPPADERSKSDGEAQAENPIKN